MFKRVFFLSVFLFPLVFTSALFAQDVSLYAVVDGSQNPPQVVDSTVDFAITDNGTGNYTLTFEQPVEFFLGTSLTEGPGFDASATFLTAVLDSGDKRKVNVNINYVTSNHFAVDGQFSLEVRLTPP